jgi:hypothetical protein
MEQVISNTTCISSEFNNPEEEAELIAVIMAALYASLSQPAGSLIVNKIRRVTGPSIAWNQAGLSDSIASRRI